MKENGKVVEKVYKVGSLYSEAITKIVDNLKEAMNYAENEAQKAYIQKLIDFYVTGSLRTFDEYSIAWVNDTDSRIDVVNGFIEVYGDPLGYRASYESVVSFKDLEATKRTETISSNAQWIASSGHDRTVKLWGIE